MDMDGRLMEAERGERWDGHRCCSRGRPAASPPGWKSVLGGVCAAVAAGLLVVLVAVPLTVTLTARLSPCAQEPTRAASDGEKAPTGRAAGSDARVSLTDGVKEKLLVHHYASPRAMLTAPGGDISAGTRLLWESTMGQAFLHGGFNYSHGFLVVPEKGHYHLMLQITFQKHRNFICSRKDHTLVVKVWFYHEDYPQDQLLLSVRDGVDCSVEDWSKSLHTSRLVKLSAGSRLKVNSTHTPLIVKNEDSTFFGVEWSP